MAPFRFPSPLPLKSCTDVQRTFGRFCRLSRARGGLRVLIFGTCLPFTSLPRAWGREAPYHAGKIVNLHPPARVGERVVKNNAIFRSRFPPSPARGTHLHFVWPSHQTKLPPFPRARGTHAHSTHLTVVGRSLPSRAWDTRNTRVKIFNHAFSLPSRAWDTPDPWQGSPRLWADCPRARGGIGGGVPKTPRTKDCPRAHGGLRAVYCPTARGYAEVGGCAWCRRRANRSRKALRTPTEVYGASSMV